MLGQRFESNGGLINEQVFEKLFAGVETYDASADFEADLFIKL